jgi:isocitrate dehydrogenase kinase/phosphatase
MNNRPFASLYLANREIDPDLPDELSRVESASVNLETDVVVFKIFYDYDEICSRTDINFRNLPVSDNAIAVGVDRWFEVGKFDVFP